GYAAVGGLAALLALRVLHGSGMGFGQTAASVAAADLAPIARRGEALGVFGLASTFGIMLGPYAGIELYERFGSTTTFLVAGSRSPSSPRGGHRSGSAPPLYSTASGSAPARPR